MQKYIRQVRRGIGKLLERKGKIKIMRDTEIKS